MAKWKYTKYPGVRYREHPTRKHGVQFDKYFSIRYTLDGKRHEEALGWASEGWSPQSAAEELARLKKAQRTGEGALTLAERREMENVRRAEDIKLKKEQEIASTTFNIIWEKYFLNSQHEKAHKSWDTERHLYKKWIQPFIGEVFFTKVTAFHLEKIKKEMRDASLSPRSIGYALSVVRQVFCYASDHGIFEGVDPVSLVKMPHYDNRRIRFLTHSEAEILLDVLCFSSQNTHDIALIALHCGPRAGEIFSLTWQDIDFSQGLVTFRDTKNKYVRHIPITKRVRKMLERRSDDRSSALVFPDRNGGRRKKVSKAFERTIKELGWNKGIDDPRQKVVFHTLRHTCASWLVMAGVPLYTVKEYLGHKQISQTERYAHLAPDSLKQATEALNNINSQKSGSEISDKANTVVGLKQGEV